MGALWSKQEAPPEGGLVTNGTSHKSASLSTSVPIAARKRRSDTTSTNDSSSSRKRPRVSTQATTTPPSEQHRFCVRCPALFWSSKRDVTRLLAKAPGLPTPQSVHKIARWQNFFVTFAIADAPAARAALSALSHRGAQFEVSDAAIARPRAFAPRTTHDGCADAGRATAPWADLPYETQCARKTRAWRKALAGVGHRMRGDARVRAGTPWLQGDGMPICELADGVFCEEEENRVYYRNKTEFTVGESPASCGIEGHVHVARPTVGYALGMSREGDFRVGSVTDGCRTTAKVARRVAEGLEQVVRESGQPVYDRLRHVGYWRLVVVRSSARTEQTVVVVMVSEKGEVKGGDGVLDDAECRVAVVKALDALLGGQARFGLFWQLCDDLSPASSTVHAEHVCGLTALSERLLGLELRVHPSAFFQVHTVMAERLYRVVRDWARVSDRVAVLDVCCGTGTIALALAPYAHSVVGIDICEPAVDDARINAERNKISNATFIAGAAEKVIARALLQVPLDRECVAVLDPPRAGVANQVISAVRGASRVTRVVYISCEPANAWRNVMALCRPTSKQFRGEPFRPVRAIGVDLFPQTPHGELVFLLERCQ